MILPAATTATTITMSNTGMSNGTDVNMINGFGSGNGASKDIANGSDNLIDLH